MKNTSTNQRKNLKGNCSKWRLMLIPVALLMGNQVKAQLGATSLKAPGVAVSADYLPSSHYIRPEDSVKTGATSVRKRYNFGAAFLLGSRIDTATKKVRTWNLGVGASYVTFSNKDYEKAIFPNELLGVDIGIQHFRSLHGRWSLLTALSVGMYTDMEKIDFDDVFVTGGLIFIKQVNPRFAYGIGAAVTNSLGTPMLFPAFVIQWRSGNRFKVDINLPEKLSVSSALSKSDELALALRLNGAAYDVEKAPVKNGKLMGYKEITLGLENTWHISRKIDFVAAGGSVLMSAAEFREKNTSSIFSGKAIGDIFKDRPQHKLATGFYLSAGVRMKF